MSGDEIAVVIAMACGILAPTVDAAIDRLYARLDACERAQRDAQLRLESDPYYKHALAELDKEFPT